MTETPILHLGLHLLEIRFVLRRKITGHLECRTREFRILPQMPVRFTQSVQPFFRAHPRKIPDREAVRENPDAGLVALQVDTERYDAHLAFRNTEVAGHVLRAIVADRDKAIHMLD